MKTSYLSKLHYIYTLSDSRDSDQDLSASLPQATRTSPKPNYRTWLTVVWPLILHAIITLGITTFVLAYINNRDFNLGQRRPSVRLADDRDSIVPWVHYVPLQTDITTILSVIIAVLRLITACWLGPLCWRCAFVLMEEFGLRPTQLRSLISYGVTIAPLHTVPGRDKRFLRFLIWAVLVIVLPVQLAAPVLTGSITWLPSNPPAERLSDLVFLIPQTINYDDWNSVMASRSLPAKLNKWIKSGAYHPFLAWGRDASNTALRRFVPEFSVLDINSTIAEITISYFTVQAIEWVDNPNSTWASDPTALPDIICPKLNVTDSRCPVAYMGSLALIPDTPWTNHTSQSPSKVMERRLLVYSSPSTSPWTDFVLESECRNGPSGGLIPNVTGYPMDLDCWKFAWVTYSAGVTVCKNCRISSYATVQNDTELDLQEGYMTAEALRLMPSIIQQMLTDYEAMQTIPKWNNADDYVIGMLTRSYAGAWMALTELVADSPPLVSTAYSVSPPASRAVVHLLRVYIWLGLQSLVSLSGILFLCIQARSNSPLIGDTTLAAFHLDSSSLHDDGAYNSLWGGAPRNVRFEDSRLLVKVE